MPSTRGTAATVVVWGDERATFLGKITARGGSEGGNGGFVEVSTFHGVVFEGTADTTAARGQVSRLLIDPPTVTIGNGTDAPDGSYLNADNLAETLVFTSVDVIATDTIVIAEDIDLENSPFSGRTNNDLILTAPTVNLLHDVLIGDGSLIVNGPALNLDGRVTSNGVLAGALRFRGVPTQVNVLSNKASIQQAIGVARNTGTSIQVAGNQQYQGNLTINKSLTLQGSPGDSNPGVDPSAPELVGTVAGGTVVAITASNVTVAGFRLSGLVAGSALNDSNSAITGSGSNITLHDNTVTGFDTNGIAMTSSSNLTVQSNFFTDIGADAINVTGGTGVIIESNVIEGSGAGTFGAGAYGVHVTGSSAAQIRFNKVSGIAGGSGAEKSAILVQDSPQAFVQGNSAIGNGGFGSHLGDGIEIINSAGATFPIASFRARMVAPAQAGMASVSPRVRVLSSISTSFAVSPAASVPSTTASCWSQAPTRPSRTTYTPV